MDPDIELDKRRPLTGVTATITGAVAFAAAIVAAALAFGG